MMWINFRILTIMVLLFLTGGLRAHAQPADGEGVVLESVAEKTVSHDAIINLGGDCQVAYQLTKHGLRDYALPFDALVTPYEALHALLTNEFEGFMTPDNFVFEMNEKAEKYILDKRYGIKLIHDFKINEKFLDDYEAVASKYERRIARLFERIRAAGYPLFIRKKITREQAAELRALLHTMRNGRPFILAALDGDKEGASEQWNFESVRNFYLKQPEPYSWKGDSQAWKEIFMALGLPVTDGGKEKAAVAAVASVQSAA